MTPFFSIVIPVYNRPDEVQELLSSLVQQSFKDFEVVIVEDGSTLPCQTIVDAFKDKLEIRYHFKQNEGQGFARNTGFEIAEGKYFIVFDSDCIIPPTYLRNVSTFLDSNPVDAFGGPDRAREDFNVTQKAISYTMTSFFTTGGTRGSKRIVGQYHPRSFNMGIIARLFQETGGYIIPFMGEDLEFSTRIIKMGYKTALIEDAFVYHKRRTDLSKFWKQIKYFGRARINLSRFHPDQIKVIHLFPLLFTVGLLFSLGLLLLDIPYHAIPSIAYLAYFILIFFGALLSERSVLVALLAPITALIQMSAYGYGLVYEWIRKLRGIDPNTKYIELY